jgi:hypothetical protein
MAQRLWRLAGSKANRMRELPQPELSKCLSNSGLFNLEGSSWRSIVPIQGLQRGSITFCRVEFTSHSCYSKANVKLCKCLEYFQMPHCLGRPREEASEAEVGM